MGHEPEYSLEAEEPEPHHRHLSHIYGVYPGWMFTPDENPEHFEASRKSLESRGDFSTGWAMGWADEAHLASGIDLWTSGQVHQIVNQDELVISGTDWHSFDLEAVFLLISGLSETPETVYGLIRFGIRAQQGRCDCRD